MRSVILKIQRYYNIKTFIMFDKYTKKSNFVQVIFVPPAFLYFSLGTAIMLVSQLGT